MSDAELTLTNANLVLADGVVRGSLVVREGKIAEIGSPSRTGDDLGGDFVFPGLIELHTDHLESHYAPRPRVRWSPVAAVQAHDAQVASSGITTVFDALRAGTDEDAELRAEDMIVLAEAIEKSQEAGRLRAEHFIHLRCEVSAPDCLESFRLLEANRLVRLASLMDHSPGQRQFPSMEAYKRYYQGKFGRSDAELDAFCERRNVQSLRNAPPNRDAIAASCRERQIVLASHDDATADHVAEAVDRGMHIAEFPTTLEAAHASRDAGLAILMGGPNIVRGASHTGNVAARTLAEAGLLDIISSDYIPFSLLQSTIVLSQAIPEIGLAGAVRMVSKNPAAAVGLMDRGELAVGLRADLVQLTVRDGMPVVRAVWREGRRVA